MPYKFFLCQKCDIVVRVKIMALKFGVSLCHFTFLILVLLSVNIHVFVVYVTIKKK